MAGVIQWRTPSYGPAKTTSAENSQPTAKCSSSILTGSRSTGRSAGSSSRVADLIRSTR